MNEFTPKSNYNIPLGSSEGERTPEEAKQYEAQQIAALAEVLHDTLYRVMEGTDGANDALLYLEELYKSLAARDPYLGHLIVDNLAAHSRRHIEIQDMSDQLRRELEVNDDPDVSVPELPPAQPPAIS